MRVSIPRSKLNDGSRERPRTCNWDGLTYKDLSPLLLLGDSELTGKKKNKK